MVIQGSIWINFSIPTLTDTPLFFMSYIVVRSIQMGTNIDYAIVIASRYQEIKNTMSHRDAMIEMQNFAFPTVITSGTILSVAGILIGWMTSEASIVGIGQSLGRGAIHSMLLVLFVLLQILLLGGGLADKASFSMPSTVKQKEESGKEFINGFVSSEICGTISSMVRANVDGMVNLNAISGIVENGLPESKQEETKNERKLQVQVGHLHGRNCFLLSEWCLATSFYQSLQTMSSFCATYCTLSLMKRGLKSYFPQMPRKNAICRKDN